MSSEAGNAQETTFQVQGMSCGACVAHVDKALRAIEGVREVEVQLTPGRARVVHQAASIAEIQQAIEEAGYEAHPIEDPAL